MLKQRNIALSVILSILTCGIYLIYWQVVAVDELNSAANEVDTSGIGVLLLSIITCSIYGHYWMYRMGRKVDLAWQRKGRSADPNLPVLYLVLSIFGLGLISYALIQSELNRLAAE